MTDAAQRVTVGLAGVGTLRPGLRCATLEKE